MKVTHQRQFFVPFIEGSLLGNVFPHEMVCKFSNQMHANHIQQRVVLVLKGGRGMTYTDPLSGCGQLKSLPVVWVLRIPTGKKQLASTFIWVCTELFHSARWVRTHTWLICGPWACVWRRVSDTRLISRAVSLYVVVVRELWSLESDQLFEFQVYHLLASWPWASSHHHLAWLSSVKYGQSYTYYKVVIIQKIVHVLEYCKFGHRINAHQVVSSAVSCRALETRLQGPSCTPMLCGWLCAMVSWTWNCSRE